MSRAWTAADFARDAAEQTEQWNADWRDEIQSQRAEDAHLIVDDRPTREELAEERRGR